MSRYTDRQKKFIEAFAIGVFSGIATQLIVGVLTKKEPPHPKVPIAVPPEKYHEFWNIIPPPGA